MTYGDVRSNFMTLSQDMTTEAQEVATQAQSMTAKVNREVGSLVK